MLDIIAWYTPVVLTLTLLLLTWRLGNYKNWKTHYSTILFIIAVSFFACVLTHDYPLWVYHETFLVSTRTMHELRLALVLLPTITLLYLTNYPYKSKLLRQLTYTGIWAAVWSMVEVGYVLLGIITFHNGWNIWWSVLVWLIMFLVMTIHHRKPPWAWFICVIFSVIVIIYFNIPFG
ncbi:hypothetical protein LGQ02_09350 [Bacillus shivajii]|uniref:CBO0543 family protein n=1 Tax=Bacillus shivajii TaxID=1983719 RepID=UPI001CFACBBA|nr:CBO0543 family protein [Bacillus shivajii]UCZ54927.1 hypothetical protein LGQ02_09350 [Bacillus shivajii]